MANDGFFGLTELWKQQFQEAKNPDDYMKFICNASLYRKVYLSLYKKIPPIEEMPEQQKKEMKKYVLSLFPEKSTQEKLECCKIIYCFGTLL